MATTEVREDDEDNNTVDAFDADENAPNLAETNIMKVKEHTKLKEQSQKFQPRPETTLKNAPQPQIQNKLQKKKEESQPSKISAHTQHIDKKSSKNAPKHNVSDDEDSKYHMLNLFLFP